MRKVGDEKEGRLGGVGMRKKEGLGGAEEEDHVRGVVVQGGGRAFGDFPSPPFLPTRHILFHALPSYLILSFPFFPWWVVILAKVGVRGGSHLFKMIPTPDAGVALEESGGGGMMVVVVVCQ
jgi:hypothetical protein